MNQKFSLSLFMGGLPIFLATASEMLAKHNEWSYFYETPLGFLHGLGLGVSFCALVIGALGTQLPRNPSSYGQRKGDVNMPDAGVPGTTVTVTQTTDPLPPTKP